MLRSKLRTVYTVIIYHNPICNILRGMCESVDREESVTIVPLRIGTWKGFIVFLVSSVQLEYLNISCTNTKFHVILAI